MQDGMSGFDGTGIARRPIGIGEDAVILIAVQVTVYLPTVPRNAVIVRKISY